MAETNGKRTTNPILVVCTVVSLVVAASGFTYGITARQVTDFNGKWEQSLEDRRALSERVTKIESCYPLLLDAVTRNNVLMEKILERGIVR